MKVEMMRCPACLRLFMVNGGSRSEYNVWRSHVVACIDEHAAGSRASVQD